MKNNDFIETTLYNGTVKVKFFEKSHIYTIDAKRKKGPTTFIDIMDKSRGLVPWATELAEQHLFDRLTQGLEITKEDIMDACLLHESHKKDSGDIGKETHAWCEGYIKSKLGLGPIPEMPEREEIQIGTTAFLDWEAEKKPKFRSSERIVYSKKYDYAGTLDVDVEIDSSLFLLDLKTSNGLYNAVRMQTSSYVRADEEESGRKYDGRWALRLAKETEVQYHERMDRKDARRARMGRKPSERKPYQVFEAKFLDESPEDMERDFQAFLHAKSLWEWNEATDFYKNA